LETKVADARRRKKWLILETSSNHAAVEREFQRLVYSDDPKTAGAFYRIVNVTASGRLGREVEERYGKHPAIGGKVVIRRRFSRL